MSADKPAILGGAPLCAKPFPTWPQWDESERQGLLDTLGSGAWWHGDGERACTFAQDFAAFQGARFGLPLTNGTHTLEAALAACDSGEGDEVIVPGMTFIASASAALAVNARPVLVDIDPATLCIDVARAEAAITPKTRAIIAVHVAGAAADLDALDCAHAHGTTWRGKGVGAWGDFGSFSMQASKLMTAGEGGVLICQDEKLRDLAWSYANCGRVAGTWFYHHVRYGANLRMTEWQGAVLSAQLARFPVQHALRNKNALALNGALSEVEGLRAQHRDPRMGSQGYYCYVFHYDKKHFASMPLKLFERALAAEGVPLTVSYPSLSELDVFRSGDLAPRLRSTTMKPVSLPIAEAASQSTVWLQHRVLLGEEGDVLRVARAAARIQRSAKAIIAASRGA
jgi:dTDP-4-amino-4,6-dideoxygalactose transaminase